MAFVVSVDPWRCENERDCLEVCPVGVFEMERPTTSNPVVRLKVRLHGGMVASPARQTDCIGCMACVVSCPEDAVRVEKITGPHERGVT